MHIRQAIRERIAELCTGLDTTGSNVFQSQYYALNVTSLPCVVVWTTDEASEPLNVARQMQRTLDVVVQGEVKQSENADDVLDDIAAEVEAAINADPKLDGLANRIFLRETSIAQSTEGEDRVGTVRMVWQVEYMTTADNPEAAL